MERFDFQLLILEKWLFLIKIFACIILLFLGYFSIDNFLNIFENISEIFSLTKFNNFLKFTDSFSRSSSPAAIGYGNNFKTHFISQFFKIMKKFLINIETWITAFSSIVECKK